MSNTNPNPATRFKKGEKPPGNGRPKGTRDRISQAFLTALSESFEKDGVAALDAVRTNDPSTYIRVIAALQPKEIELKRPLDGLDDGKLDEVIGLLRGVLQGAGAPPAEPEEPRVMQ